MHINDLPRHFGTSALTGLIFDPLLLPKSFAVLIILAYFKIID